MKPSKIASTRAPASHVASPEPGTKTDWLTTGEMARLSNNTLRTVRFYEEAGILEPVGRTEGGHRLFERAQLDRLQLVSDMREAGLSLEEIRVLLETKSRATSGGAAATEATKSLRHHLEALRGKIQLLSRLHDDLAHTVEVASACLGCEGPDHFPDHCGECNRLGEGQLPRGMRVLWSISQRSNKVATRSGVTATASPLLATSGDAEAPARTSRKASSR